jgi:hypothetical protein
MLAKAFALTGLIMVLSIGWAYAIVVDGVNDFAPADLVDPDSGDTEYAPIDLGDVYVTYDESAIYIGYGHDHDGWTGVQIGIAIMFPLEAGGTTDPWGHQIVSRHVLSPVHRIHEHRFGVGRMVRVERNRLGPDSWSA